MGFKIGVAIPIGYYHGTSGETVNARIEDEAGAVFGAELTLVENAAFAAVGITGYYESSFTPDAAGRWTALIYFGTVKYGQMFYDVGGGLTTQEKTDVEAEAKDALEGEDLDHLIKVAHPTGDPVADTLFDLIMNKDGGQTFARASDSLEALAEAVDVLDTDVEEAHERAFLRRYPFVTTNESVSNAAEVSLAAPAIVTPTFPTGATRLNSYVVAILKANNQTAAEHNIGVTLQKNIAGGGWVDVRDFTANPPLTLPEVDATADSVTFIEPVSITSGQSVQFRFQVDSDNAGEVHYTQVFFFALEYDFQ